MTKDTTLLRRISDALASSPKIYDLIQRLAGFNKVAPLLRSHFDGLDGFTLLDVGAGTGLYLPLMPNGITYIWTDIDPQKLAGFRDRAKQRPSDKTVGVMSDSLMMSFADKSVDYAFCAAMSHHIADDDLERLFGELARVVRKEMIFLDAVKAPRLISRALWALDRGAHPRPEADIISTIEQFFNIERRQSYQIYHRYVLCSCSPKEKSDPV